MWGPPGSRPACSRWGETLEWNEYLVTGLNMACNLVTEFLYDRFFVFGKSLDTNSRAKRLKKKNA